MSFLICFLSWGYLLRRAALGQKFAGVWWSGCMLFQYAMTRSAFERVGLPLTVAAAIPLTVSVVGAALIQVTVSAFKRTGR